ncbi:MAG: ergothioneine biosynthesis protein EgtB [Verrucomicrobiota bacterium]|nr:ergothioneine biosynthesis protein EgtB [Verrucomicrobiota bacterium]
MSHAATLLAVEPSSRPASAGRSERLLERFRALRDFTTRLCRNLQPEDCVVQSMPDVSPTKWHLAHTTWFFETFVVKQWVTGYQSEVPEYAFLFNSYYNAAGTMHRRDLRGLISRPTLQETKRYRASIDEHVVQLIERADEELLDEIEPVLILGFHHEQQHQELLVTDIKHVFAQNPLYPIFEKRKIEPSLGGLPALQFVEFGEAIVEIGHAGSEFSYDNEGPRHRALVGAFALANRLVTNGEYLAFMHDHGYQRPEFWLSLGWTAVQEQGWHAPLYWEQHDGAWWNFTLSGFREVNENEPVTHLSQFEADAYANWAGARLPTEFEWERASANLPLEGNFVDEGNFHPVPVSSSSMPKLAQMFGDVWEWTRSAYLPYPGYRAAAGALGEYNGKFMSSQMVLRGGSCATTRNHLRATYRNFFPPDKRWQFSGLRLARDLA